MSTNLFSSLARATSVVICAFTFVTTAVAAAEPANKDIVPLDILKLADGSEVVVDENKLTVYTFDRDTTTESTCYGACEKAWPPVLAAGDAKVGVNLGEDIGLTTRKDGKIQLTHDGHPIYFYVGDSAEGDINGDGLGGVWHVIRPD